MNHRRIQSTVAALMLLAGLQGPAMATSASVIELNNEGVRALTAQNFRLAIQKLEEALSADPEYQLARGNLAIAYNNLGLQLRDDPREALKLFHKAFWIDSSNATTKQNLDGILKYMSKDPNSFRDRVELGNEARKDGDFNAAIIEYSAAVKIANDPRIHELLGDLYRVKDLLKPSIAEYQQAAESAPSSGIEVKLGQTLQASGDLAGAINHYAKALKLNPSDTDALDAAVSGWESAISKTPTAPENHIGLGQALQWRGDFTRARDEYQQALRLSPGKRNSIAESLLAALPDEQKKFNLQRAQTDVLRSGEQAAKSLFDSGSYDAAIQQYKNLLSRDLANSEYHYQISKCYQRKNELDQAISELRIASKMEPSNSLYAGELQQLLQQQAIANKVPNRVPSAAESSTAPANCQSQAEANSSNASEQKQHNAVQDKWALIIGISEFANPEYRLKYAAKDAEDFRNFLVNEQNFRGDHVKLLTNKDATKQQILEAFGDNFLPNLVRPGDLVVIYISTHGTPSSRDKGHENFIAAYDTDKSKLYSTGVNMQEINDRIKSAVNTDRVLIVLDTCYSGNAAAGARGIENGANFNLDELAQKMGTGRLVITSSGPEQQAWESKSPYQNGIFTRYLINALRQNGGRIDVRKAFETIKPQVDWEAHRDYGVGQTPQIGGQWEGQDLILSVNPIAPRPMASNGPSKVPSKSSSPSKR